MGEAPFKLAFRSEGDYVNCYLAAGTDKTLLSSMRRTILEEHGEVYEAWKSLMSDALRLMISSVAMAATGKQIDPDSIGMFEREAPESEKSGRA